MQLQKFQNSFYVIPVVFSVLAIISIAVWGLRPSIDLAGGSVLQVEFTDERPQVAAVEEKVDALAYGDILVQAAGEKGLLFRQRVLTDEEKKNLSETISSFGEYTEIQYNSVGPSIGDEMVRKAWWAIALVTLCTILFIAFAFRHVSKPVSSWKYGFVAIVTLLHDILIPVGLFAFLGHVRGAEVGVLFIVALLTILGISINDTIVVFDRIRENLSINEKKGRHESFKDVVWRSITQTMARSINTSVTVIVMLLALFVYGPESTKDFSLTLIVGMVAGTYSSIFLASPLLLLIERYQKKASN